MDITFSAIEQAEALIGNKIVKTPVIASPILSQLTGTAEIFIKLENQQYTGSFKDRGALNKLIRLTQKGKITGVIAMSAGNHAQGVACYAQKLNIPATIVMPEGTPFNKVERTKTFGARVILKGESIDQAAAYAHELAQKEDLVFIHPYDDPDIIIGQGTLGLEFMKSYSDLDILVVPIGGGGLISGVATVVKAINPKIKIIGVEATLFPSMHHKINNLPPSSGGQTIAEGIAVKSPGEWTIPIVKKYVEEILLVDEAILERAVEIMALNQKMVTEGAGAAGLAAILAFPNIFKNKRVGLIISGGNIDPRVLSQVLMRGMLKDGRMVTLRIEINDQPGVLAKVSGLIGAQGGNIIEIHHQRMFSDLAVKLADVDAVIETRNITHINEIADSLRQAGFATRILSSRSYDKTS
ncbi:MAG: threonine ammonia-lyase [Alphaproteobacteria bacterium]|nr:threonine ammonia-lyase [Alphaproteobacteria bacterium]